MSDPGPLTDDRLREAAQDIAEGRWVASDSETGDEWCFFCEAMTGHEDWCSWVHLRAALAIPEDDPTEPDEYGLGAISEEERGIDVESPELDVETLQIATMRAVIAIEEEFPSGYSMTGDVVPRIAVEYSRLRKSRASDGI